MERERYTFSVSVPYTQTKKNIVVNFGPKPFVFPTSTYRVREVVGSYVIETHPYLVQKH